MKIAVTDTNIFIYLKKANLLDGLFRLGYEIHTTENVINELGVKQADILKEYISSGELIVYSFTSEDIIQIENAFMVNGLSFIDKGLFYYSQMGAGHLLLTNDSLLKKSSLKREIEVHGILWVLDLMLELKVYNKLEVLEGLKAMLVGYNRLPVEECKKRLVLWDN